MLWALLTYVGYLAALGGAVGAGLYVAQTRFGLVQRLLATAVDKTLRRVAETTQAAYSVTHTDTGEQCRHWLDWRQAVLPVA